MLNEVKPSKLLKVPLELLVIRVYLFSALLAICDIFTGFNLQKASGRSEIINNNITTQIDAPLKPIYTVPVKRLIEKTNAIIDEKNVGFTQDKHRLHLGLILKGNNNRCLIVIPFRLQAGHFKFSPTRITPQ